MSSDNWTKCPKCRIDREELSQRLSDEADAVYGSIPRDEWVKLVAEAQIVLLEKDEYTLREDYELGVGEDGEFTLDYYCSCSKCGFSYGKKMSEQVLG